MEKGGLDLICFLFPDCNRVRSKIVDDAAQPAWSASHRSDGNWMQYLAPSRLPCEKFTTSDEEGADTLGDSVAQLVSFQKNLVQSVWSTYVSLGNIAPPVVLALLKTMRSRWAQV